VADVNNDGLVNADDIYHWWTMENIDRGTQDVQDGTSGLNSEPYGYCLGVAPCPDPENLVPPGCD